MGFTTKQDSILVNAIDLYGFQHQKEQLTEEIGELLLAFSKFKREGTVKRKENLLEELADVKIMIRQF